MGEDGVDILIESISSFERNAEPVATGSAFSRASRRSKKGGDSQVQVDHLFERAPGNVGIRRAGIQGRPKANVVQRHPGFDPVHDAHRPAQGRIQSGQRRARKMLAHCAAVVEEVPKRRRQKNVQLAQGNAPVRANPQVSVVDAR